LPDWRHFESAPADRLGHKVAAMIQRHWRQHPPLLHPAHHQCRHRVAQREGPVGEAPGLWVPQPGTPSHRHLLSLRLARPLPPACLFQGRSRDSVAKR